MLHALLLVLAMLLVAALATGWWLLAGSRARLDGVRRRPGLSANVSISRDALGTVTLEGKSRTDLSYALGYVHAQERFFAMDLMRRVAAGELSALVGPAALKVDLDHRRHRLRAVVEAAYAQLPPAQKLQLDRYR
ncbi:MAG TPA: penicillin acylase family protein, partial [Rhodanobacter sp.]